VAFVDFILQRGLLWGSILGPVLSDMLGPPVPDRRYDLLEHSRNVLATVPTPKPNLPAMARILSPCARRAATLSRLKIFLGRWGARFFPDRLETVLPTFPAA
jgi:hypothetical protein